MLPIALSAVLPGLNIYSNLGIEGLERVRPGMIWITSSIFLYVLWHLLWVIWDLNTKFKYTLFLIIPIIYISAMYGVFILFSVAAVNSFDWSYFFRVSLGCILFIAIQYALKTQQNISRLLLEKEQMQNENYKAQIKALHARIDPHFLFNSLNTLRSMVRQQHSNSEQFIMSLSDFYRQTLKYTENTTLQLSKELAVLQSYLFLMQNRNGEAIAVHLDIDDALEQKQLPTLALQVVAENCFKHNSMTTRNPLKIEIKSTDDHYIQIKNNIQPIIGEKKSTGFGLASLKKRYELMQIKDGVLVEQSSEEFSVKLKLI